MSKKDKSKNLEQNSDNLKHFLMKDFNYDCKEPIKLIDESIVANIIKSIIFIGKVAFRIIRVDANADDTITVPETQEDNSHIGQNEGRLCCTETGVIEDSQTPLDDQQVSNMQTIIENVRSSLELVEQQFMKIEDHMIGLSNPISATIPNTIRDSFYTNLIKNRIYELETFYQLRLSPNLVIYRKIKKVIMVKLITTFMGPPIEKNPAMIEQEM